MLHSRVLRYLDEVARVGSIRGAAERLNVASSAINKHVLLLEEAIGEPLFERLPRGLRLTAANVGPISSLALDGLWARGILTEPARDPLAVTPADLAAADLVIAVSADEHRPMLTRAFPDWAERVTYWQVEDLHLTPADDALPALEREVRRLVERLHAAG